MAVSAAGRYNKNSSPDRRTLFTGLSSDDRPVMAQIPGEGPGPVPGDRLYREDDGFTLWASENREIKSIEIDDGGESYEAADALTFAPTGATGTVDTVDANGAITAISITARGSYSRPPTVTAAATTGSGAVLRAVLSDGWRYMDPAPSGETAGAIVDS